MIAAARIAAPGLRANGLVMIVVPRTIDDRS
jgi:hypothetical protein